MIMFWGPSNTGKTALLSYLFLRAKSVQTDWDIFPEGEASNDHVDRQQKRIIEENLFPLNTAYSDSVGELEVSYKFEHRKTKRTFLLETKDMAGRRSEDLGNENELLTSLVTAQGIVLFLDPTRRRITSEVERALRRMYVERTRTAPGEDHRPVAICLSKIDRLIKTPQDLQTLQNDPERFVKQQLGSEMVDTINQYQKNVRYFPVSAVGICLSFGTLQKSIFYDERLELRVTARGTPINILEPFLWIFDRLAEAP